MYMTTPIETPHIELNLDLMPDYKRKALAKFVINLVRETFAQPGEEDRYQAWLEEERASGRDPRRCPGQIGRSDDGVHSHHPEAAGRTRSP